MADANITDGGDLVLTPQEVEELGSRAGRLMQWFMRRYPELSGVLPASTRSRWAGVCRQLVGEYTDDQVNAICVGLPTLFPYSEGQPFDPFKMRRRAPEALVAGLEVRRKRAEAERERRERQELHARLQERINRPLTPEQRRIGEEYLEEMRRERARRERARERLREQGGEQRL